MLAARQHGDDGVRIATATVAGFARVIPALPAASIAAALTSNPRTSWPAFDEVGRHRPAHVAEPDKSNNAHDRFLVCFLCWREAQFLGAERGEVGGDGGFDTSERAAGCQRGDWSLSISAARTPSRKSGPWNIRLMIRNSIFRQSSRLPSVRARAQGRQRDFQASRRFAGHLICHTGCPVVARRQGGFQALFHRVVAEILAIIAALAASGAGPGSLANDCTIACISPSPASPSAFARSPSRSD